MPGDLKRPVSLLTLIFTLVLAIACESAQGTRATTQSGGTGPGGDGSATGGDGGGGGSDDANEGSGGEKSQTLPGQNGLFRLSTTRIDFDSRNDEVSAIVEVEALRGTVTVSATPLAPAEIGETHNVVSQLKVTDSDGTARVRITRAGSGSLPAGVFRGQVRVRGCSEGSCEDLLVEISYTVVHVELVGHQGFERADIVFRRRVDEELPEAFKIPMVASDGSAFDWSIQLTESSGNETYGWLDFTASGRSDEPLVVSPNQLFDRPLRLSAMLAITTDVEVAHALVIYDTLLPIEVSSNEIHLTAKVGEQAEPAEFEIYDAYGGSYSWSLGDASFVFGCSIRKNLLVELAEGSFDALPAVVRVTAEASDQVTATPTECFADLEVKHERTTEIVHQKVRVSVDVTE